jgi:hypothetical protein
LVRLDDDLTGGWAMAIATRLLAGLLASVLAAIVLVLGTAGGARAACQDYTGCVATHTQAMTHSVMKGEPVVVCGKVTVSGNLKAVGRLRITIRRDGGEFELARTKRYDGGTRCLKTSQPTSRGRYFARASYRPARGSAFGPSSDLASFRVK